MKHVHLLLNKPIKQKVVNKQKDNEAKQKATYENVKEAKAKRETEAELFGEVKYDDEYAEYEDKFY